MWLVSTIMGGAVFDYNIPDDNNPVTLSGNLQLGELTRYHTASPENYGI